jgi:hypothetical protein
MINLDNYIPTKDGFLLGSTFRGLDDSAPEEIYLYLFFNPKEKRIPSTVRAGNLKEDIIKFFSKPRFESVAFTKDHQQAGDVDITEQHLPNGLQLTTVQQIGEDCYEDDNLFYFVDTESDKAAPTLIKLAYKSPERIFVSATSYNQEALLKIYSEMKKYVRREEEEEEIYFGILYSSNGHLDVKKYPLDDNYSKNLDLKLHYGDAFAGHHKQICDRLNSKRNGILIFHGEPGSGKTTYIKHLAKAFGGTRTFIFIPTTFIDSLVSPNIIPLLLDNKNSVLVLEDAEKALVSREQGMGNESVVSSLLNIGDGILGSMLNISMVVTFNTGRENIDKALLRKGRLMYEHKFDKLGIEDAQRLINKLNKNHQVTEPMSLADIYNLEVDTNHKKEEQRAIGFGR